MEQVTLEPKDTPIGRFQKERTDAISEMFDNVDEYGIYPTGKFFARLDNCVRELLESQKQEKEVNNGRRINSRRDVFLPHHKEDK